MCRIFLCALNYILRKLQLSAMNVSVKADGTDSQDIHGILFSVLIEFTGISI